MSRWTGFGINGINSKQQLLRKVTLKVGHKISESRGAKLSYNKLVRTSVLYCKYTLYYYKLYFPNKLTSLAEDPNQRSAAERQPEPEAKFSDVPPRPWFRTHGLTGTD
jgi:hypothetical protein